MPRALCFPTEGNWGTKGFGKWGKEKFAQGRCERSPKGIQGGGFAGREY